MSAVPIAGLSDASFIDLLFHSNAGTAPDHRRVRRA